MESDALCAGTKVRVKIGEKPTNNIVTSARRMTLIHQSIVMIIAIPASTPNCYMFVGEDIHLILSLRTIIYAEYLVQDVVEQW